jgi:transposase
LTEAQHALEQVPPEAMLPLKEGYRYHVCASTYGGVAQRWMVIYSEHRRAQAQRTVDKHWRQQSEAEVKAFQKLCRTAFACEADAQHALTALTHDLHTTTLCDRLIRPMPRYRKRGRPGPGAPPARVVFQIEGALASSIAAHEALVAQQSCFILATNALDDRTLPPQELLDGYKGQQHVERGFRFLKDPRFLASSLYLKKPERIMALLMVMTVCLLVYAALEFRIRKGLMDSQATFPNQKGQPVQNPTARWVFQYFGGIHLLRIPGEGAYVLNVTDQHRQLLRLLGHPYEAFYS